MSREGRGILSAVLYRDGEPESPISGQSAAPAQQIAPDLQRVIDAWPALPGYAKAAILALLPSAEKPA